MTANMIKLKVVQRSERRSLNQVAGDGEYWRRIAAHILALPIRRRVRSVTTLTVFFPRHPITHRLAPLQTVETMICAVSALRCPKRPLSRSKGCRICSQYSCAKMHFQNRSYFGTHILSLAANLASALLEVSRQEVTLSVACPKSALPQVPGGRTKNVPPKSRLHRVHVVQNKKCTHGRINWYSLPRRHVCKVPWHEPKSIPPASHSTLRLAPSLPNSPHALGQSNVVSLKLIPAPTNYDDGQ